MPPELHPGQSFEINTIGFDGMAYHMGVTAARFTVQPKGGEQATLSNLGVDQHTVLRYIAGHLGVGFRAADVYPYFDEQDDQRRRFNEATFDAKHGLHTF